MDTFTRIVMMEVEYLWWVVISYGIHETSLWKVRNISYEMTWIQNCIRQLLMIFSTTTKVVLMILWLQVFCIVVGFTNLQHCFIYVIPSQSGNCMWTDKSTSGKLSDPLQAEKLGLSLTLWISTLKGRNLLWGDSE